MKIFHIVFLTIIGHNLAVLLVDFLDFIDFPFLTLYVKEDFK